MQYPYGIKGFDSQTPLSPIGDSGLAGKRSVPNHQPATPLSHPPLL